MLRPANEADELAYITQAKEMTHGNDHIRALHRVALAVGNENACKVLQGCLTIRNVKGATHDDLNSIYKRWYTKVIRYTEIYKPDLLDKVREAL